MQVLKVPILISEIISSYIYTYIFKKSVVFVLYSVYST